MLMNRSPLSQQTRTDAGLAAVLRVAVGRLARRLRAQRPDTSLSLGQSAVLFALARYGQMTPGALAEHEKVQPPSMTRIIAALEARSLYAGRPTRTTGASSWWTSPTRGGTWCGRTSAAARCGWRGASPNCPRRTRRRCAGPRGSWNA